jgi:tetratricopeptide (TPR) repeat protein
MARCWTCGTKIEQTIGDQYICESCEDISNQIRSLHGDVKYATERVSGKFDDLIFEQRHGFNALSTGIQNIARGMNEFASVIEWGFGELSWQVQQQTSLLQEQTSLLEEIKNTLEKQRRFQADDLRVQAEENRSRGDYKHAIEYFLESLHESSLDYRTYIGLAETYLRIGQFTNAKIYLENSLHHAPASGNFSYKSYSLRLIGRIYYCWEDYENAIKSLKRAIELSPDYTKAYYDLAQYYAVNRDVEEAILHLRRSIEGNSFYFDLAIREKNFNSVRDAVLQLREEMKGDALEKAKTAILNAETALQEAEESEAQVYELEEYGAAKSKLVLAKDKADSGIYESILEVKRMSREVYETAKIAKDNSLEKQKQLQVMKAEQHEKNTRIREEHNALNISAGFHILFLMLFVTSIFAWNFGAYILAAICEGVACSIWSVTDAKPQTDNLMMFIVGFVFAPLAFLGVLSYFSSSSAIDERSKKGLREIDNKYASKLGIQKLSAENWVTKGLSYAEAWGSGAAYSGDWEVSNGPSYAETESRNAAINSFNSALGIDIANDRAWVSKGICLERLDKTDEAIACCDRALKLNPEDFEALNNKGIYLDKLGRIEEALSCYDGALKKITDAEVVWCVWYNKGRGLMKLGRFEEAITCYNGTLKIKPEFIEALLDKGLCIENLAKFEEAIDCYSKVLEINPEHESARKYKEACLQKL